MTEMSTTGTTTTGDVEPTKPGRIRRARHFMRIDRRFNLWYVLVGALTAIGVIVGVVVGVTRLAEHQRKSDAANAYAVCQAGQPRSLGNSAQHEDEIEAAAKSYKVVIAGNAKQHEAIISAVDSLGTPQARAIAGQLQATLDAAQKTEATELDQIAAQSKANLSVNLPPPDLGKCDPLKPKP